MSERDATNGPSSRSFAGRAEDSCTTTRSGSSKAWRSSCRKKCCRQNRLAGCWTSSPDWAATC